MSTMNLWTRMIALTLCLGLALPAVAAPGMGMGNAGERGGKEGKVPIYALARQADLTTLADLVEIAGLQRTLQVEGPLTVRSGPATRFRALLVLPDGTPLDVACAVAGERVAGPAGASARWLRLAAGGYVPAALVQAPARPRPEAC